MIYFVLVLTVKTKLRADSKVVQSHLIKRGFREKLHYMGKTW
jgi:hypothetical protein